MQVSNLTILPTCRFDDYLLIPGYSYSGIKSDGKPFKTATRKMNLGSDVHNYLLKPDEYHFDNLALIKPLAIAVKKALGELYKYLLPEIAFTANFVYNGFSLPYKGRADLALPKRVVVDLKVSEMPLVKSIPYFGYDNQVGGGYASALACPVALIIGIHPITHITSIYNVPLGNYDWWHYHILQKGEPIL